MKYYLYLLLACVLAACIQEIDLSESDTRVPYIDGGVRVGTGFQTLDVGLTDGFSERPEKIIDATVIVDDLTDGVSYEYKYRPDLGYFARFGGQPGHAYQLRIDIPDYGSYASVPDSLPTVRYSLSTEEELEERVDRDGNGQLRNFMTNRLAIRNLDNVSSQSVLLIRPLFAWSYTDDVCSPFDISRTCYIIERENSAPFRVLDLGDIDENETAEVTVGSTFINFRMAESSMLLLETSRRSAAAAPYFESLGSALNQTGSLFSERPTISVGNMQPLTSTTPLYGYFGVFDEETLYEKVDDTEILRRASEPLCFGAATNQAFDCCNCLSTEGALADRPIWWR